MASKMSQKLSFAGEAVEKLREAIVSDLIDKPTTETLRKCCHYSEDFKPERGCVRFKDYGSMNTILKPSKMLTVAQQNLRSHPALKYQYFAETGGTVTQFPGNSLCEYEMDFINQPSFSAAAFPGPKDFVIVIDSSYSEKYHEEIKDALTEAVENFLKRVLDAEDRFTIISFSNSISVPTESEDNPLHCDERKMTFANAHNIYHVMDWLKKLPVDWNESSVLEEALKAGFDYFADSGFRGPPRRRIMVLLSQRPPKEDAKNILQTIKDRNQELGDSVVIMTYGIGRNAPEELLREIAHQDGSAYDVEKSPNAPQGEYSSHDKYADELSEKLLFYYKPLRTKDTNTDVQFSLPHSDYFEENGLVITASAAVTTDDQLKGVVSVDISMRDLAAEVVYHKGDGERSYTFIVDRDFRTIAHPFMPAPSAMESDSLLLNITLLQTNKKFISKFLPELTKLWNEGDSSEILTQTVSTTWMNYVGPGYVTYSEAPTKISCKPLLNSNLAACAAVRAEKNKEIVTTSSLPENFKFQYHRLDLQRPDKPCSHIDRSSFRGSSVKFAPKAFKDVGGYLGKNETSKDVTSYENAVKSGDSSAITEGAIHDVRLSFVLEEIWKTAEETLAELSALTHLATWRYLATESGVLRTWPGGQLPHEYDHTKRVWYTTAMAYENGEFIVSTAHKDAVTGLPMVTFATPIKKTVDGEEYPYGVMGFDVFLKEFEELLSEFEEDCSSVECISVDSSGYVVYHPAFLHDPDFIFAHIILLEPEISMNLILKGFLIKNNCSSLEHTIESHSYVVNTKGQRSTSLEGAYRAEHIEKTNLLLIVKYHDYMPEKLTGSCILAPFCGPFKCQSPCIASMHLGFCPSNSSSIKNEPTPLPCWPAEPKLSDVVVEQQDLEDCYESFADWKERGWMDDDFDPWIVTRILGGAGEYGLPVIIGIIGVGYALYKRSHRQTTQQVQNIPPPPPGFAPTMQQQGNVPPPPPGYQTTPMMGQVPPGVPPPPPPGFSPMTAPPQLDGSVPPPTYPYPNDPGQESFFSSGFTNPTPNQQPPPYGGATGWQY